MKNRKEVFVNYMECSEGGEVKYKAKCPYCGKENVVVYCEHENCEKEVFYDICEHFKGFGAGSFRFVNIHKEKKSKLNKLFKEYRELVIKQAELEIEAKSLDVKMAEIVEKSGLTGLDFLKEYYKWLKTLKEVR